MTWCASSTLSSPRSCQPSTRHFRRKNWRPSSPSTAKLGTPPIPIPELALPEPSGSSTSANSSLFESCRVNSARLTIDNLHCPNHGKADFPDTPAGVLSVNDLASGRQISHAPGPISLREHSTRHFLDTLTREW